jgi:hydroxypyruvate isomerase
MPTFSANLTMMYQEVDFLDRFGLAAADGFEYVEFLFPYTYPAQTIVDQLTKHGLKLQLFNLPPGDYQAGERGIAILPDRQKEFDDGLALAIEYAQAMDCPNLHLMAGIIPEGYSANELRAFYLKRIEQAAIACETYNIDIVIEPINTITMPGYFLNYQAQAIQIIQELLLPNVKLMMDFFHAQLMEGNLENHLRQNLPYIGHIQIAGVPSRHEPNIGEVNYQYLLPLLVSLGYEGTVGCEYRPLKGTSEGLKWMDFYR